MSPDKRRILGLFLPIVIALANGCTSTKHLSYKTLVKPLDEYNVLEVSTYPAGYGNTLNKRDSVLAKRETHNALYFQIFIRDKNTKMGAQPHIESIEIDRFSYRLPGDVPVTLLSNYNHYFWMQGNPNYDAQHLPPVPYVEDSVIHIDIVFSLNGNDYHIEGEMPAQATWSTLPTVVSNQGI